MKGFSALILVVVVGALFAGASFLFRGDRNIKGVSTEAVADEPGFLITISSKSDTWDLNLYGCASDTECTRISKTGGGATELKEVKFSYVPDWARYSLLKVSILPGRPNSANGFKVLDAGDITGTKIQGSAIFVPVEAVTAAFHRSAVFSDF